MAQLKGKFLHMRRCCCSLIPRPEPGNEASVVAKFIQFLNQKWPPEIV